MSRGRFKTDPEGGGLKSFRNLKSWAFGILKFEKGCWRNFQIKLIYIQPLKRLYYRTY